MNPLILCIETSSEYCSVAIQNQDQLYFKRSTEERSHSTVLTELITETLEEASIKQEALNAIAISSGPGSYTGLRIGSSTAKGMCYALDIPLIGIETFEILREGLKIQDSKTNKKVMAMIDARRMEVYMKSWNEKGDVIDNSHPLILDEVFSNEINSNTVYIGDGAFKIKQLDKGNKCLNIVDMKPQANYMIDLAQEYYSKSKFENIAYFEPFYLKEFYTTRPKKRIFSELLWR